MLFVRLLGSNKLKVEGKELSSAAFNLVCETLLFTKSLVLDREWTTADSQSQFEAVVPLKPNRKRWSSLSIFMILPRWKGLQPSITVELLVIFNPGI